MTANAPFNNAVISWDEKAGLHGMRYAPINRRARSTRERRPAVKKISTMAKRGNEIFKEPKLTIGLDLGDRTSHYCILDEAGNVILEHRLPTTPRGIHQVFCRIPRSRIALETGTHSPWVSRQLTQLGHEVIVAHARNVRLIGDSRRKDDQLDARTLARLARIDPQLVGPVRHRGAKAQIQLTLIQIPPDAHLVSACFPDEMPSRNASSSAWKVLRSTILGAPSSSLVMSFIVLPLATSVMLSPLRRAFGRWLLQRRTPRPTSGEARHRRRSCRASSTTCTAGSGGNPLASPPKSPDGRAA